MEFSFYRSFSLEVLGQFSQTIKDIWCTHLPCQSFDEPNEESALCTERTESLRHQSYDLAAGQLHLLFYGILETSLKSSIS
jgi:hypothetical protein